MSVYSFFFGETYIIMSIYIILILIQVCIPSLELCFNIYFKPRKKILGWILNYILCSACGHVSNKLGLRIKNVFGYCLYYCKKKKKKKWSKLSKNL